MATKSTHGTDVPSDTDQTSDLKRKLLWRMGVAGLMIIALLSGLALFDFLMTPRELETETEVFSKPVPVAKKIAAQPVSSPDTGIEDSSSVQKMPEPEGSEPPLDKNAPIEAVVAGSSPVHNVRGQNLPVSSLASRPQENKRPAEIVEQAKSADGKRVELATRSAATTPLSKEVFSVETGKTPRPPLSFQTGFKLQAGIFTDHQSAEALQTRLSAVGIPSTIESRVQVGPFANRAEALKAQEKLKELGVSAALILPKAGKR